MAENKAKRIITSALVVLVAFTLACACFINTAIPTAALASGAEDSLDFSLEGSEYTESLSPSELLGVLGFDISEAEGRYLDRTSPIFFSYDVGMTTAGIRVILKPSGDLEVLAASYSYTARNGASVSWNPVRVSFGGKTVELAPTGDADFPMGTVLLDTGVDPEDTEAFVSVEYESTFSLSYELISELLCGAYTDAVLASEKIQAEAANYEALSEKYAADRARYLDYLIKNEEYLAKKALYEEYLDKRDAYDLSVWVREEYERKLAEYERLSEEYRIFKEVTEPEYDAAYARYLAYKDAYDYYAAHELAEYEAAMKEAEAFREHLKIIETVKTPMTDGRTLYDAIMGSTVTQVLSRQKEIVAAGVPEELVTLAGVCTENLRELFTGYFSLKTEEEKYFYYAGHYTDFRDNFYNLLRALDYFYTFDNNKGLVRTELIKSDKAKKYVILLAQLYTVTSALHDGKIYTYRNGGDGREFTSSYTWSYSLTQKQEAYGNATVVTALSMLENKVYLTDTNSASPYEGQFPELFEKPEPPEEVQKPGKPIPVYEPTEPAFVPVPGDEPTPVDEPTAPEEVLDPGEEPEPYVPTDEELWLADELKAGSFTLREPILTDQALTRTYIINKKISPLESTTVSFYLSGTDEPIYVTTVDSGTAVNYRGPVPSKPTDAKHHYEFSHWVDGDGERVDLTRVEGGQLMLYPAFKTYDVKYPVTFIINGVSETRRFGYGEIPSPTNMPEDYRDEAYVYTFASWDVPLAPVSGIATYTAVYEKTPYYEVRWHVGDTVISEEYTEGKTPVCPVPKPTLATDGTYVYTFLFWDKDFKSVTSDADYTAVFKKSYLLPVGNYGATMSEDDGGVSIDLTKTGKDTLNVSPVLESLHGKGLSLVTSVGTVYFDSDTVGRMLDGGVRRVGIVTDTEGSRFDFTVIAEGAGRSLTDEITYRVDLCLPESFVSAMRLYSTSGGDRTFVPYTVSGECFTAEGLVQGKTYSLAMLYKIGVMASDGLTVTPAAELAAVGERVEFSLLFDDGVALNKLYFITEDGTAVQILDDFFVMPEGDVKLFGSTVYATYKIRFVNYDGRYITRTCKWGEIPTAPTFVRNSDGVYSYTFVGWDSEPSAVTGDFTYTAVYEGTPLPPKSTERTFDSDFEKFKYYALLYAISVYRYRAVVIVSFAVSLGSLVGLIVLKKHRKKHPIS